MDLTTAIEVAREHNQWRRGDLDHKTMQHPKLVGDAIDVLIENGERTLRPKE